MLKRPVPDLASALREALPSSQRDLIGRLARVFAAEGQALYLVGGIVRDLLLERRLPMPLDLDLATSSPPETTQRLGHMARPVSVYDVGARFGTIGFMFGDGPDMVRAEITTYRAEHYPDDTRFPTVRFGESIHDDLARRDFTVNAIAAEATTGTLIDPFDGQADLHQGILRAVGNPDERFVEDPLRLLRAARFVAQLGFRLDPETEAAMARHAASLARISQERVWMELSRLLTAEYAPHGLEALRRTGVLTVAMPELLPLAGEAAGERQPSIHREKDLWDHTLRVVGQADDDPVVRWSALLHDAAKPLTRTVDTGGEVHFFGHERIAAELATRLLRRLKADRTTQVAVSRIVELHGRPTTYDAGWTDSAVRRLQVDADGVLEELLQLAAADVTSAREEKQRAAAHRVDALRAHIDRLEAERALDDLQSPLDGHELMALFARPPGIWIKQIKEHLRELVLDGELDPDDKIIAERIAREMMATDVSREGIGGEIGARHRDD